MKVVIEPGTVTGPVMAPPSKSMTQRAFAGALLHKGTTIITGAGQSNDEQAALGIIRSLGATIHVTTTGTMQITSYGVSPVADFIDCQESGLSARLFTPIGALSDHALHIKGSGTLLKRPMEGIRQTLSALGVALPDFNGRIPFLLHGPIQPKSISIDASGGSQLLSGLLFALTASTTKPITVTVKGLKSKPYIDMTLAMLEQFGKPVTNHSYHGFHIDPALFTHKDEINIKIEGDWSGAANLIVAGAIAGDVTVTNVSANSAQADKAIVDILRNAGANLTVNNDRVTVQRSPLQAFEFDATDSPDLFPILAILAACCEGESNIAGVHRLFHKESNRAESITQMLDDFAVPYSIEDDILTVTGVKQLCDTVVDSYNDHRIVMAAAIGALRAKGPVTIDGAEAVRKSYPTFFEDLAKCGVKCENS